MNLELTRTLDALAASCIRIDQLWGYVQERPLGPMQERVYARNAWHDTPFEPSQTSTSPLTCGQSGSSSSQPVMDMRRVTFINEAMGQSSASHQTQNDRLVGRSLGGESCNRSAAIGNETSQASSQRTNARAGMNSHGKSGCLKDPDIQAFAACSPEERQVLLTQLHDLQQQLQAWQIHESRVRQEVLEAHPMHCMNQNNHAKDQQLNQLKQQQQKQQKQEQQLMHPGFGVTARHAPDLVPSTDLPPPSRASTWLENGTKPPSKSRGPLRFQ